MLKKKVVCMTCFTRRTYVLVYVICCTLVDLSVAIMHVNVSVAIIQLEVSAALMQVTVSASNM